MSRFATVLTENSAKGKTYKLPVILFFSSQDLCSKVSKAPMQNCHNTVMKKLDPYSISLVHIQDIRAKYVLPLRGAIAYYIAHETVAQLIGDIETGVIRKSQLYEANTKVNG
jgi:hypothetical protein